MIHSHAGFTSVGAPRVTADNHPAARHAREPLAPAPEPPAAVAARHRLHELGRHSRPILTHVAGIERQRAAIAVGGDDLVRRMARVGEGYA